MTKEIIIVLLLLGLLYLHHQNNLAPDNSDELKRLQQEANRYQTLYQKRVEKDTSKQVSQTEYDKLSTEFNNFKEVAEQLEINWENKKKSLTTDLAKSQDLNKQFITFLKDELGEVGIKEVRTKLNGRKLTEILNHLELKDQTITNLSEEVKGLKETVKLARQELSKSEELKAKISQQEAVLIQQDLELKNQASIHQQQLKEINLLFDEKAQDYETIDFNGLYSLLEQIKAERERESKIPGSWKWK